VVSEMTHYGEKPQIFFARFVDIECGTALQEGYALLAM